MFDPNDFLILSKELSKINDEAKIRTSISRAYYSAFLISREYLTNNKGCDFHKKNDNNKTEEEGGIHKKIIENLKSDPELSNLALFLKSCRDDRNNADYNLKKPHKQKDASACIKKVELVINKIKSLYPQK